MRAQKPNFKESSLNRRWNPLKEFSPKNTFRYRIIPYHGKKAINFISRKTGWDFLTIIENGKSVKAYIELTRTRCVEMGKNNAKD